MKYIQELINGIVEVVGSRDVYDIASHFNIHIIKDNPTQNPMLMDTEGVYIRDLNDREIIIIRDDLGNEIQVLAHELGHALLHVQEDVTFYGAAKGRMELEADYFATRLLYEDIKLENGRTVQELSQMLKIKPNQVALLYKNL